MKVKRTNRVSSVHSGNVRVVDHGNDSYRSPTFKQDSNVKKFYSTIQNLDDHMQGKRDLISSPAARSPSNSMKSPSG